METTEDKLNEMVKEFTRDLETVKGRIVELKVLGSDRELSKYEKQEHEDCFELLLQINTNLCRVKNRYYAPDKILDKLLHYVSKK